MATFLYLPDYGARKSHKPRVKKYQFGDGYEQRAADGLNADMQTWSLVFKRNNTVAEAIDDFLRARKAVESFNWTTPEGEGLVVVCDEWDRTIDDLGWQTITATFRQVPETAAP